MIKFKLTIRTILWFILTIITICLFYLAIVPFGKIAYVYDFQKPSEFILPLTPVERVEPAQNGSQKIIGDPVYFSLRTPRTFDTAKIRIKYKNNSNAPLIEAGVLTDAKVWNYNLQPIENQTLDKLAKNWTVVREGDLMLLQRNKNFENIEEFLKNLPGKNEIALYNYDGKELNSKALEFNSVISPSTNKEFNSIRGSFQFYTYLKQGEKLDFKFSFQDLNESAESDAIDINLYSQDKLILSRHLDDNGELASLRPESVQDFGGQGIRNQELGIREKLNEGVYKVEVKGNDDIVTKDIQTKQRLSFVNKIWLNEGENLKIFTDSRFINVQTVNPGSLQKIKAGGGELDLSETYKQFGLKLKDKISEINIPKGDVILSGDGVFAFSPAELLNPGIRKIDANFDADTEGINYILARYQSPREENGWKIAEAEFNLKGVFRQFYKYSFMLSVPGLKSGDVEVGEIKVELKGRSLGEKIKEGIR